MNSAAAFLAQSREYLTGHYLPKIRAAVGQLGDADLWWRPNEASNSVGNLLLHLAGNIRQWIVSGLGNAPDQRDRAAEFARRDPLERDVLLTLLTEAIFEADAVIARADPAALDARLTIQGRQVSVLQAIYHVVEHLALHAGQIIYIAKLRGAKDLGFYRMEGTIPRPNWPGHPTAGGA